MIPYQLAALLLAALGTAVFVTSLTLRGRLRDSVLPIGIELWTAAGALRLVGSPRFGALASAAAILCVRRIVIAALHRRKRQ
jgi:hypothetical protein